MVAFGSLPSLGEILESYEKLKIEHVMRGKFATGSKFPLYSYTCFYQGVRFLTKFEHKRMKYIISFGSYSVVSWARSLAQFWYPV